MEIEKSPQGMAKKLCSILRIVFHMLRNTIPKNPITLQYFHTLLDRGKFAISSILLHHHRRRYYSALTCRSTDITATFISPQPYQFSCSSSPAATAAPPPALSTRRRRRLQSRPNFDSWNRQYDAVEVSSALPGFGAAESQSATATAEVTVRNQVDRDAEEFIRKFYRELKNQRRIAALESPSPPPPLHLRGR